VSERKPLPWPAHKIGIAQACGSERGWKKAGFRGGVVKHMEKSGNKPDNLFRIKDIIQATNLEQT